CQQWNYPLITF
nr:immunoglobulin light chain junction region [Mus musculus]